MKIYKAINVGNKFKTNKLCDFNYFSKKEFKNRIKNNPNYRIAGCFRLKKEKKEKNTENDIILLPIHKDNDNFLYDNSLDNIKDCVTNYFNENENEKNIINQYNENDKVENNDFEKFNIINKGNFHTKGYVLAENINNNNDENKIDTYIKYSTFRISWLIVASLILFLLIGFSIYELIQKVDDIQQIIPSSFPILKEDDINKDWDGNFPNSDDSQAGEQENVEIIGYTKYTVTKEKPTINLINSKKNTVYFVYVIYDISTNKEIYKTNAIPPNKMVEWDAYNTLKVKGYYTLGLNILTYDIDTKAECNGANTSIDIYVK